jgi:hypothetical protein
MEPAYAARRLALNRAALEPNGMKSTPPVRLDLAADIGAPAHEQPNRARVAGADDILQHLERLQPVADHARAERQERPPFAVDLVGADHPDHAPPADKAQRHDPEHREWHVSPVPWP